MRSTASAETPFEDPIDRALAELCADRLVAFPTETVWGIAARANSAAALEALFAWKGRDRGQPISVLVSGTEAMERLGFECDPTARRLCDAFWPGPLTLVLPSPPGVFADGIANADGAVGLRCSPHPVAAALIRAAEQRGLGPLTATSCNKSGEPAAATLAEVRTACGEDPDAPQVLEMAGGECFGAEPSTVLDCSGGAPRVLREGAISRERLESVLTLQDEPAELPRQEA